MAKKCSLKFVTNTGKTLHGNAAVLKKMSQSGGYDKFVEEIVKDVITESVPIIAKQIIEKQQRPSLTVVK